MGFNWFESMLYGLISGLTYILPVSAQAHKIILQKLFGVSFEPELMSLLIHIAVLAALYFNCTPMMVKIVRALKLARVPKKRRKRPLDTKSLMDFKLIRTMIIPAILAFFFYQKTSSWKSNLILVACIVFVNGLILYIPQYLPGSNKDSRMLSRIEGLLMGLGGSLSVIPGFSGMGVSLSVGSICGVDRSYCLSLAFFLNIAILFGRIVFDIMAVVSGSIGLFSASVFFMYVLSAVSAFFSSMFGIRIMRHLAAETGYTAFAYYCWGTALFIFVLNLLA